MITLKKYFYILIMHPYKSIFSCHRDDLLALQEQKLLKLFTAFSRDQDQKMYVI